MGYRTNAWCAALAALALGCSSSSSSAPGADDSPAASKPGDPGSLTLSPVPWNQANQDLGTVVAVLEQGNTVAVFGSNGVMFFTSGVLVGTDTVVKTWKAAAVVPAADGIATWMIGVDADGKLQRVRTDAPPADVTDRFGLASKVQDLAGAPDRAVFLLDGGFAIADGKNLTRYDAPDQRAIAAANGKTAVATDRGLRIFDQGKETDVALAGAAFVAFDGGGNVVAATAHRVYTVSSGASGAGGALTQAYDAGTRTIHGLAAGGENVWFSVDGDIGLLAKGQVSLGAGGTFAPDARLVGSPSGDVWVTSGGKLSRFAAQVATGDEASWIAKVRPVHDAICANCHSAKGSGKDSSNIDLSTYALWVGRKPKIRARVIDQAGTNTQMPPKDSGYTLTADQKAAIDAWSKP